jgi:cytochrome c peroxidase
MVLRRLMILALMGHAVSPAETLQRAFPDATGTIATYAIDGHPLQLTGAFFQPLSSNGRSCSTCHRPAQAWSVSADEVKARFETSKGLDPIFRPNDGANCDHNIETTTLAGRRAAYSLLTGRGLIRMAMHVPASADFEVVNIADP